MKVQTIELKEIEFVEVDGEYEARFINARKYPIFLTNYAMQKGKKLGLLESDLISDLAKLLPLAQSGNESEIITAINEDEKLTKVIYLAFIGANRKEEIEFDEFIEKYHYSFTETTELFMKVIEDAVGNGVNGFAKGLKQSTKSEKKSTNLHS